MTCPIPVGHNSGMPPFAEIDDRNRFYCWGCGAGIGRANGVSLSGDTNDADTPYELCYGCHEKIDVRTKVTLSMLLRSREQGGLGAGEALEEIVKIIRASLDSTGRMSMLDYLQGGDGAGQNN